MHAGIPVAAFYTPALVTLDTVPLIILTSTQSILTISSADHLIRCYPALQFEHPAPQSHIFTALFADSLNALQTDC